MYVRGENRLVHAIKWLFDLFDQPKEQPKNTLTYVHCQLKQSPGRLESCDVTPWENKTLDVGAETEWGILLIAAL